MPAPTRLKLTRIAFHEASHVVASYLGRRRFRYATIIPDGDCLGHVRYTAHREPAIGIDRDATGRGWSACTPGWWRR
jgi:hypothetical protein